jgi:DNA polymerase III subunit beta
MKFEASSGELLRQLNIASGAISANPILPIMEDYLFTIKDNILSIRSTNLETTISTQVAVTADQDGSIAVPAKILLDTIKALPEQPVTFEVNDDYGITIRSAFGKYNLSGDNPDDFPDTPKEEDVETIVVNSRKIQKGIVNTIFATSNDELRPAMTGVLFVATDAHKLVKYTLGNINSDITRSLVVPKKGLLLVKNALVEDTDVNISFNKTNIFFSFDNTRIICRLIDAKYPEYNAVIPVDNPYEAIINRKDFLNSLRRISIYANKSTNQVVLNLTDLSLTVSAQDLDFSNEATEQMNCTFNGEPMTIGYNGKFLGEMLNVLECDEIKLQVSTPNRAGIIVPTEEDAGEQLLMLVMPVMMGN